MSYQDNQTIPAKTNLTADLSWMQIPLFGIDAAEIQAAVAQLGGDPGFVVDSLDQSYLDQLTTSSSWGIQHTATLHLHTTADMAAGAIRAELYAVFGLVNDARTTPIKAVEVGSISKVGTGFLGSILGDDSSGASPWTALSLLSVAVLVVAGLIVFGKIKEQL